MLLHLNFMEHKIKIHKNILTHKKSQKYSRYYSPLNSCYRFRSNVKSLLLLSCNLKLVFTPCSQSWSLKAFFLSWLDSPVGPNLLMVEVSRSHPDIPYSVGLLWTSYRPVAENSTWQHTTQKRRKSMLPVGFETRMPARKGKQTYALDRAVTGIGIESRYS
jgi:hypothetical protein